MAYNPIDASFAIKENNSLSDAQKMSILQSDKDREEQRQQRLYEKQQQNQWRNQGIIGDDLNFDKYKTGEQAIELLRASVKPYKEGKTLKEVRDEMFGKSK